MNKLTVTVTTSNNLYLFGIFQTDIILLTQQVQNTFKLRETYIYINICCDYIPYAYPHI